MGFSSTTIVMWDPKSITEHSKSQLLLFPPPQKEKKYRIGLEVTKLLSKKRVSQNFLLYYRHFGSGMERPACSAKSIEFRKTLPKGSKLTLMLR